MVKAKVSRGGHVSYRTPLAAVPAAIHSQPLRYVGKVCGRVRVRVRVAGAGQHAFALLSMLSPPLLPSSPSSTSSSEIALLVSFSSMKDHNFVEFKNQNFSFSCLVFLFSKKNK